MNIYKAVKLLIAVAIVSPVFLQAMDGEVEDVNETDAEIVERAKKSGYIVGQNRDDFDLAWFFAQRTLLLDLKDERFSSIVEDICAGCNIDPLFEPVVISQNIVEICDNLAYVLSDNHTNDHDRACVRAFLKRCITSGKITKDALQGDSVKNLFDQANQELEAEQKTTTSKIGIHTLVIPVFAVGAVAVIAYKWWSKRRAEAKKADVDIDEIVENKEKDEHI